MFSDGIQHSYQYTVKFVSVSVSTAIISVPTQGSQKHTCDISARYYNASCMFHASFQVKSLVSGAKMCIRYTTVAMFLCCYRHVLQCFCYVGTENNIKHNPKPKQYF